MDDMHTARLAALCTEMLQRDDDGGIDAVDMALWAQIVELHHASSHSMAATLRRLVLLGRGDRCCAWLDTAHLLFGLIDVEAAEAHARRFVCDCVAELLPCIDRRRPGLTLHRSALAAVRAGGEGMVDALQALKRLDGDRALDMMLRPIHQAGAADLSVACEAPYETAQSIRYDAYEVNIAKGRWNYDHAVDAALLAEEEALEWQSDHLVICAMAAVEAAWI